MTREEAKEILEKIQMQYDTSYEYDALDMAIKALSEQKTVESKIYINGDMSANNAIKR